MIQLGDIRKEKNSSKSVWTACVDCGKPRWVQMLNGKPKRLRCSSCGVKKFCASNPGYHYGTKSPCWKGGRRRMGRGYIAIWVSPDSLFAPMRDTAGYVPEHRLVYAQYLGRPLKSHEIINHKDRRLNSNKEKDNRLDNLALVSKGQHDGYTQLEHRIRRLESQNEGLLKQIKLLQWQIKELQSEKDKAGGYLA